MSKLAPNPPKTKIDKNLNQSAETPLNLTKVDKNKVKKVKLATKPNTTAMGFRLPDWSEDDKMMGRSGKIQGDKTVTIPAKKAKMMRSNMYWSIYAILKN